MASDNDDLDVSIELIGDVRLFVSAGDAYIREGSFGERNEISTEKARRIISALTCWIEWKK